MKLKNSTLNHSFIYISGSLVQALAPFLLIPILTRNTTQETFGLLMLMIAFATVLSFIFSLGVPAILTRDLIYEKSEKDQNILIANRFQTLLFWISFILITISYVFLRDTFIQYWLFIFSISFSLSLIQIRLSVLRAQSKSLRFALLAILSTGFPLLVVSALVITDYQNVFFAFALAILFVALTVQFRFIFSFPKYANYLSIFKLISVGYPMIFHSVSISLFQYGDKLSGYLGLGAEIVSQIVIMSIFMTAPMLLLSTINNAWLPAVLEHFYKSQKDGFTFSNKVALKLNWLITLISLGIMFASNLLVQAFTPITYERQAITNSILIGIIASPLYILYLQNTHLITINKEFKKLATITPVAAAVQFIFTFGLVGKIGLLAPALGFIFALLIQVILTSFATRKISQLNKFPIYSTIFLALCSYFLLRIIG